MWTFYLSCNHNGCLFSLPICLRHYSYFKGWGVNLLKNVQWNSYTHFLKIVKFHENIDFLSIDHNSDFIHIYVCVCMIMYTIFILALRSVLAINKVQFIYSSIITVFFLKHQAFINETGYRSSLKHPLEHCLFCLLRVHTFQWQRKTLWLSTHGSSRVSCHLESTNFQLNTQEKV